MPNAWASACAGTGPVTVLLAAKAVALDRIVSVFVMLPMKVSVRANAMLPEPVFVKLPVTSCPARTMPSERAVAAASPVPAPPAKADAVDCALITPELLTVPLWTKATWDWVSALPPLLLTTMMILPAPINTPLARAVADAVVAPVPPAIAVAATAIEFVLMTLPTKDVETMAMPVAVAIAVPGGSAKAVTSTIPLLTKLLAKLDWVISTPTASAWAVPDIAVLIAWILK